LCRRGRYQLDEPVQRDPPRVDAAVEDEREAVLDSGQAVRDLGEVAFPEIFLTLEMERAMVGRDQLQVILEQTLPELIVMRLRSQRRRADVFGALEAGPAEVFQAEIQILRAGLGKGRRAVVARKMAASSSMKTPGYAMNSLKEGTPSLTSPSISLRIESLTSRTIMWKP